MSELEIAKSQIVALTTSNVLLRGELVTLREKLAAARRDIRNFEQAVDPIDRGWTEAEIDKSLEGWEGR